MKLIYEEFTVQEFIEDIKNLYKQTTGKLLSGQGESMSILLKWWVGRVSYSGDKIIEVVSNIDHLPLSKDVRYIKLKLVFETGTEVTGYLYLDYYTKEYTTCIPVIKENGFLGEKLILGWTGVSDQNMCDSWMKDNIIKYTQRWIEYC